MSDKNFKPWRTEIARLKMGDVLMTFHSTGQFWSTKPDGTLIEYQEMNCRFGCLHVEGGEQNERRLA